MSLEYIMGGNSRRITIFWWRGNRGRYVPGDLSSRWNVLREGFHAVVFKLSGGAGWGKPRRPQQSCVGIGGVGDGEEWDYCAPGWQCCGKGLWPPR